MTLQQCLDKTKKLINYYSISGETVSTQDPVQKDYTSRALSAIDTAQKELAARRPLVRHICFTQHRLQPLASLPGFRRIEGSLYLQAQDAAAFSLLCDGNLTLRLESGEGEEWESLYSTSHTAHGQIQRLAWQAPAGSIPVGKSLRLFIESDGAFLADAALYAAFPQQEDIPILGARRFHSLPENFSKLLDCHPQGKHGQIMRTGFACIDNGKIGFPWDFEGVVWLAYTAYPCCICDSTDPSAQLELAEDAAEAIPFYAAAMLLTQEDPKLSEFFLHTYTDKLRALEAVTGFQIRNQLFEGGRR